MVDNNGRLHDGRRYRKPVIGSARSETPHMHGRILRGNRESLCLPKKWAASGSLRTHADDVRTQAVGRWHSTCEVSEQTEATWSGGDGGKAIGQGECTTRLHVPDTGPDTTCQKQWSAYVSEEAS